MQVPVRVEVGAVRGHACPANDGDVAERGTNAAYYRGDGFERFSEFRLFVKVGAPDRRYREYPCRRVFFRQGCVEFPAVLG